MTLENLIMFLLVHSHNILRVGTVLVHFNHLLLRQKDRLDQVAMGRLEAFLHQLFCVLAEILRQMLPALAAQRVAKYLILALVDVERLLHEHDVVFADDLALRLTHDEVTLLVELITDEKRAGHNERHFEDFIKLFEDHLT